MSPLELEWLKYGLLGLVVLSESLVIRKLYTDSQATVKACREELAAANEERDEARREALATLERVLTAHGSRSSSGPSSTQ